MTKAAVAAWHLRASLPYALNHSVSIKVNGGHDIAPIGNEIVKLFQFSP